MYKIYQTAFIKILLSQGFMHFYKNTRISQILQQQQLDYYRQDNHTASFETPASDDLKSRTINTTLPPRQQMG